MKYRIPTDNECADILTDAEFKACLTETATVRRGRAKAWAEYRAKGPTGQLRELSQRSIGDHVVLMGYMRSAQISAIVSAVSVSEGVQFRCSLERSLIDGSAAGVRVTLAAFTR